MPVGYNIAANTYLPDPLTTTRGKALRSNIKSQELERAMAPKVEARRQQEADSKEMTAQARMAKVLGDLKKESAELSAEQIEQRKEVWTAGKNVETDGGDTAASTEAMRIKAKEIGSDLPKDFKYDGFSADAVLSDYETYLKESNEGSDVGYAAKDTYEVDGKKYHGWYDDNGKFHKTGILAESTSGEKITYDPPNKAELEAAEDIIKKEIPDLDGSYKDIATMWLASEIRNRQERHGESYDTAVAIAIASIKVKLVKEKDFFSGSDDALSFGGGLQDDEFLGQDGNVYVETEDGFRRKD